MTTFTTSELKADTDRVLATTMREGEATILGGDGLNFKLQASRTESPANPNPLPDFAARLKQQGMPRLTQEQVLAVDRMIAGE